MIGLASSGRPASSALIAMRSRRAGVCPYCAAVAPSTASASDQRPWAASDRASASAAPHRRRGRAGAIDGRVREPFGREQRVLGNARVGGFDQAGARRRRVSPTAARCDARRSSCCALGVSTSLEARRPLGGASTRWCAAPSRRAPPRGSPRGESQPHRRSTPTTRPESRRVTALATAATSTAATAATSDDVEIADHRAGDENVALRMA